MRIHETLTRACRESDCYCGASPGQQCICAPDTHLARVARAHFHSGSEITAGDFATLIHDADTYGGSVVVIDPEGETAA